MLETKNEIYDPNECLHYSIHKYILYRTSIVTSLLYCVRNWQLDEDVISKIKRIVK